MNIQHIKVSNLESRNGNKVPNQFWITVQGEGHYFQSYETMIAFKDFDGNVSLDAESWDYSVTTGKYRNIFLGENKAETAKKIKLGVYKLVNLN